MKKESIIPMIGLMVAQSFITLFLYGMCAFFSLITLSHYFVVGLIVFPLYALIWWFIWWIQYGENGIPHFYSKLVSATIPLIAFTTIYICAHPVPTNKTMIALLTEDIHFDFSTAVTCTLLFPLYSIALNRYLLPRSQPWFRYISVASTMIVVGAGIFTTCYRFLPKEW